MIYNWSSDVMIKLSYVDEVIAGVEGSFKCAISSK